MFHLIVYILLIVAVNIGFTITPLIALPSGDMWPPMSLVVGFTFVVRDFAQRKIGHNILWGMVIGSVISWFMASPELAVASATAFAVGETADWLVYTMTKRSFSQRILISSAIGAPLDSLVFLSMVGLASPWSLIAMSASKLVGSLGVFWLVRRRERQAEGYGVNRPYGYTD